MKYKNQKGASLIMVLFSIILVLAFLAFSFTFGYYYFDRNASTAILEGAIKTALQREREIQIRHYKDACVNVKQEERLDVCGQDGLLEKTIAETPRNLEVSYMRPFPLLKVDLDNIARVGLLFARNELEKKGFIRGTENFEINIDKNVSLENRPRLFVEENEDSPAGRPSCNEINNASDIQVLLESQPNEYYDSSQTPLDDEHNIAPCPRNGNEQDNNVVPDCTGYKYAYNNCIFEKFIQKKDISCSHQKLSYERCLSAVTFKGTFNAEMTKDGQRFLTMTLNIRLGNGNYFDENGNFVGYDFYDVATADERYGEDYARWNGVFLGDNDVMEVNNENNQDCEASNCWPVIPLFYVESVDISLRNESRVFLKNFISKDNDSAISLGQEVSGEESNICILSKNTDVKPTDITFVIDESGSMGQLVKGGSVSKLANLRKILKDFVKEGIKTEINGEESNLLEGSTLKFVLYANEAYDPHKDKYDYFLPIGYSDFSRIDCKEALYSAYQTAIPDIEIKTINGINDCLTSYDAGYYNRIFSLVNCNKDNDKVTACNKDGSITDESNSFAESCIKNYKDKEQKYIVYDGQLIERGCGYQDSNNQITYNSNNDKLKEKTLFNALKCFLVDDKEGYKFKKENNEGYFDYDEKANYVTGNIDTNVYHNYCMDRESREQNYYLNKGSNKKKYTESIGKEYYDLSYKKGNNNDDIEALGGFFDAIRAYGQTNMYAGIRMALCKNLGIQGCGNISYRGTEFEGILEMSKTIGDENDVDFLCALCSDGTEYWSKKYEGKYPDKENKKIIIVLTDGAPNTPYIKYAGNKISYNIYEKGKDKEGNEINKKNGQITNNNTYYVGSECGTDSCKPTNKVKCNDEKIAACNSLYSLQDDPSCEECYEKDEEGNLTSDDCKKDCALVFEKTYSYKILQNLLTVTRKIRKDNNIDIYYVEFLTRNRPNGAGDYVKILNALCNGDELCDTNTHVYAENDNTESLRKIFNEIIEQNTLVDGVTFEGDSYITN